MSPDVRIRARRESKRPPDSKSKGESLEAFFRPAGIVVIGASGDPKKLGFVLTRNLLRSGYEGAVHLVNRRGKRALSRSLYSTVSEVPDPVDLAVIVVPAAGVPAELERCADRGIPAAIVISGGFRESGAQGEELEKECRAVSQRRGIRLLGPNCIGLIDTHAPLDTTFLTPPGAPKGDVGMISQSGSFCAAAIDWSRASGFGWSRIVSLGNQVDLDETDLLEPVGMDAETHVITMYLEGVRNGRRFVEEAEKICRQKPIVALKVGQSQSGRAAVSSHTGAMAGEDRVIEAAFRRAGIFRAHTTQEMMLATRALAWTRIPHGSRVGVLTNAGGPGVAAVDELEHQGLAAAKLSPSTLASLRRLLPSAASIGNPVDMLASASPDDFAGCLSVLLGDEEIDAALVILPPPPAYPAEKVVQALQPILADSSKPVVFTLMGGPRVDAAEHWLEEARIPVYRFPEHAVTALAALVHRGVFLRSETRHEAPTLDFDEPAVRAIAERFGGLLAPDRAAELASTCGIPTAPTVRVESGRQAARVARKLGYPIVLKAATPSVVHKSDIGGVALGIPGGTALVSALRRMRTHLATSPSVQGDPIYFLQPMAAGGQDVVVGAIRDPQFGPVIMFGSGGIDTEVRGDVAFELAPMARKDAFDLVDGTDAGMMLGGFRGSPALDRDSVIDVILRVARLMKVVPEITEFEINPLRVQIDGVTALDVRCKMESQTTETDPEKQN